MIYPKASAPASFIAYEMANERAGRWRRRCMDARAEVVRLEKRVKELEDAAR